MSLLSFIPIIGNVLDKIIPDGNERKKAKELLEQVDLTAEWKSIHGQLEINKTEAAHKSLFVAGWRPATGWFCAVALLYNTVIHPLLSAFVAIPPVDTSLLYPVLLGMLGLGGMRSFEKMKKVAREK